MREEIIKAGFIQLDVNLGRVEANLQAAAEQIEAFAGQGVRLAVLPEMWSCGFDNENLKKHARRSPEILSRISELAIRNRMVICGSLPEIENDAVFNTHYAVDADGETAGAYRKIHLFTLTGEERYFAPGNRAEVCQTSVGTLGLMICYDLRFPELCRALALKGAELVIVPAQWPLSRISRWDILVQARAIENQLFLIACNRSGKENDTVFGGHSAIVGPDGKLLSRADEKTVSTFAELDFRDIQNVRQAMPCLEERMPSAYDL